MVVAPPVHVHVLVVQITFLLFAVVARVVPPVVWVGARVAPLHDHELPVVQELPRPREVHHESEVRRPRSAAQPKEPHQGRPGGHGAARGCEVPRRAQGIW